MRKGLRFAVISGVCAAWLGYAVPATAQDGGQNAQSTERSTESLGVFRAEPPQEIDLLADTRTQLPPDEATPAQIAECKRQQEAALLSEQIVVCGEVRDQSEFRTMSREDAQARYARETNTQGAFGAPDFAPDVAGPGIFRGAPTVGGLCLPLSCPPGLPEFIDVTALPEAPPGSDADRIARGLPPIGNDTGIRQADGDDESAADGAPPVPQ